MQKWYRADFEAVNTQYKDVYIDSDYFMASSNKDAINIAMDIANQGVDFADIGHVDTQVAQIAVVDDNTETWDEIEIIYY